jgi:putative copper export protein
VTLHSILLFFHLLGASIWFGGHVVLSFVVLPRARRREDPQALLSMLQGYWGLGLAALAVQAMTGPMLALRWVPRMSDWFRWQNSTQDHIASKVILLPVLLILTLLVRRKLWPRLAAGETAAFKSAAKWLHTLTFISFLMLLTGLSLHTFGFDYQP